MDADLGPAAGRATASAGHPGPGRRPLVRRRRGVCRRVHGTAGRVHRHRRPPDVPTHLRRLGRRRDLGRPFVSVGPRSHRDCSRALRRHVGPQALVRLRVRNLHGRLGPVRAGSQPRRPVRVPCPPGRRGGDAPGQQSGHHRAGGAGTGPRVGPSDCRAQPRRWDSPSVRPSVGCCWRPVAGA